MAVFVVATNSSASASSLVLTVTSSTANGDNIQVGVTVNTAGAVPSVTDSQGNPYKVILTDITNTGAQLYVFESAGAAALSSVTPDTITITVNSA